MIGGKMDSLCPKCNIALGVDDTANGLVYAPPYSCQCSIGSMINNFNALYTDIASSFKLLIDTAV